MKDVASTLRRTWPAVAAGVIALILAIALGSRGGEDPSGQSAAPNVSGSPSITVSDTVTGSETTKVFAIVSIDDLPREARETIDLIDQGGPYPYDQDDSVFQNREGLLPDLPRGSYREYTVETPGESDRGARRIVKARDGTLYYTSDHYESFQVVER